MPSVRYFNQSAPFWDAIAAMEENVSSHPAFGNAERNTPNNDNNQERPVNPWEAGGWGFPFGGPFAHRGRGHPAHARPGPPPPAAQEGPAPPAEKQDPEEGSSEPRGPPPPFSENDDKTPETCGPEYKGRCHGARGRHGWGARGGCTGRRGGPPDFAQYMGNFAPLAEMFQSQLFGDIDANAPKDENFKPEADVFDTPDAFVVHLSLPGAKKEDVGVSFDAEKSELSVAGVVYRPGDEEFLKTLEMGERKIGAFERKVRLGSRAHPAQVDVEAISARMEDGVLRIDVPKLDADYIEVKKVDIE